MRGLVGKGSIITSEFWEAEGYTLPVPCSRPEQQEGFEGSRSGGHGPVSSAGGAPAILVMSPVRGGERKDGATYGQGSVSA